MTLFYTKWQPAVKKIFLFLKWKEAAYSDRKLQSCRIAVGRVLGHGPRIYLDKI